MEFSDFQNPLKSHFHYMDDTFCIFFTYFFYRNRNNLFVEININV